MKITAASVGIVLRFGTRGCIDVIVLLFFLATFVVCFMIMKLVLSVLGDRAKEIKLHRERASVFAP